jgi:hypothetical protein
VKRQPSRLAEFVFTDENHKFITAEARQRILPTWPVPPGMTIFIGSKAHFAKSPYVKRDEQPASVPQSPGFFETNASDRKKRFRENNSQTVFASGSKTGCASR